MTTSDVVPRMIPARVSSDRSLWLRISASDVRIDSKKAITRAMPSLVPQGLDGVEPGRLDGGVEAEEDPDDHREGEAEGDHRRGEHDGLLDQAAHPGGE